MDSPSLVDVGPLASESDSQYETPQVEAIQPRFMGEVDAPNLPSTETQPYQTFSIPQQRRFKTFPLLQVYLDHWTMARGYALRIDSRGKKGKDGLPNSYYLCCTKATNRTSYVSKGQRNKPSHSTGCTFKMTIGRDLDHDPPYYYIRNHHDPNSHNHEPMPIPAEHANIQRLYIQGREARQKLNTAVDRVKAALDKLIEDEGEKDDWASGAVLASEETRTKKNEECDNALASLEAARADLKRYYGEMKTSPEPKRKKQRVM